MLRILFFGLVICGSAVFTNVVLRGASGNRLPREAAATTRKPGEAPSSRHASDLSAQKLNALAAARALAGAWQGRGAEKPDGPRIALPEQPSELQLMMLASRSRRTRQQARDLRRRFRLELDQAIVRCWKSRPAVPIRARFSALLMPAGAATVEVRDVSFLGIDGAYALSETEQACLRSASRRVTALPNAAKIVKILGAFEINESVDIEWPCGTCSAGAEPT